MGILSTAAPLRLTYLSTHTDLEKDGTPMDDRWLTSWPLRNRNLDELSLGPSVTGSVEGCFSGWTEQRDYYQDVGREQSTNVGASPS